MRTDRAAVFGVTVPESVRAWLTSAEVRSNRAEIVVAAACAGDAKVNVAATRRTPMKIFFISPPASRRAGGRYQMCSVKSLGTTCGGSTLW